MLRTFQSFGGRGFFAKILLCGVYCAAPFHATRERARHGMAQRFALPWRGGLLWLFLAPSVGGGVGRHSELNCCYEIRHGNSPRESCCVQVRLKPNPNVPRCLRGLAKTNCVNTFRLLRRRLLVPPLDNIERARGATALEMTFENGVAIPLAVSFR